MGYHTEFEGVFSCSPPMPRSDRMEFDHIYGGRHEDLTGSFPGIWCDWEMNRNGDALLWNGAEKFYDYIEWLKHIITKFMKPKGYTLNGQVRWRGEDFDDIGMLDVLDNKLTVKTVSSLEVDWTE